jgi:hypothetical protein
MDTVTTATQNVNGFDNAIYFQNGTLDRIHTP